MATARSEVWPPALEDNPELAATVAGVSAVTALLHKGVPVALTKENSKTKKSSPTQRGSLVLNGDSLIFGITRTQVSTIRAVVQEGDACRVLLKEDAPGSSFRFSCTDGAGDLSSLQVTKCMVFLLRQKLLKEKAAETSPSNSTELLEALGLVEKYGAAFDASGIPFENLGVVTGDDLAELVGVTQRLDQINIMAQIKRRCPDPAMPLQGMSVGTSLLRRGVRVTRQTLPKKGGGTAKNGTPKQHGTLSLNGEGLKFGISETKLSSILAVGQENNTCQILLKDGAPGSSFSFSCTDELHGLSSLQVTNSVALSIRQIISKDVTTAGEASPFAELLEPLGLLDKYGAAFSASGVPVENLGVVKGTELTELLELMGANDRIDRINIKAQIARVFQEPPPTCRCNQERSLSGQPASGGKAAGKALEGLGALLEAIAGV